MKIAGKIIAKIRSFGSVKLFYSTYKDNFGDILSYEIVEKLSNKRVSCCQSPAKADIVAIGSLLDLFLKDKSQNNTANRKELLIWGSGFIADAGFYSEKEESFVRDVNILALRGKLSKERMESITNKDLSKIALGDPGLLASKLIDNKYIKKTFKLGVIPHYVDQENEFLKNILVNDYLLIDITDTTENVLEKIASCEVILSSAMHGLIAADSLRVPNGRAIFSDKVVGGNYKFKDYYSAFDMFPPEPFDLREKSITEKDLEDIKRDYSISKAQVEKICEDLLKVFPVEGSK